MFEKELFDCCSFANFQQETTDFGQIRLAQLVNRKSFHKIMINPKLMIFPLYMYIKDLAQGKMVIDYIQDIIGSK